MRRSSSFIGKVGPRTALAAVGGAVVVAASVAVATVAVAGGGPDAPIPSTPSAPAAAESSLPGPGNAPGSGPGDTSVRDGDDMSDDSWGHEDDGLEANGAGMEMGDG